MIEFNKFKIIFDISHLDSVTNLTNRCYTKIDINKITHLNWKRKFKRKSKIRLFAWYNSCESAYYTATLFKGKTIRFKFTAVRKFSNTAKQSSRGPANTTDLVWFFGKYLPESNLVPCF